MVGLQGATVSAGCNLLQAVRAERLARRVEAVRAAIEVKQYTRHDKSGKTIEVGNYSRSGTVAMRHGLVPIHRKGEGKEGKWHLESGEEIPDHSKKLVVPPAWQHAHINPDPKADLQAVGMDTKGRVQRVYSESFTQKMANEKFSRNSELMEKADYIFKQNEANLKSNDKAIREAAACMKLIQQTGIRPGSDNETGAEKQAYGATTLEGRHVVVSNGKVSLQFIGKKGVSLNIPVTDESTAQMLIERANASAPSGKLFKTDDAKLRDYSHTLNGGSFKPKDFRTLKGTQTAMQLVKSSPEKPSNLKEFKKRVMEVARKVSEVLGNTPTIALQSYINPFVFNQWKLE